ncbi:protein kinase domain-containing protein [Actinomadura macrotermitis]|uniref:Outer membrane protein assembly factor BamB n=1 Tax=Actinomadura macrotermitis TaxID=2585200 RepID=A0A7K0C780_9ACTN|nr:serine/threonine-protein kinase [Actinomadura macrotermitis]MQY09293.1 Outer membrane protein assembly factor BamB [Actinomadura macrotermitis]
MAPLEADDPAEIGGYQLVGRLGAGGMGQVFLGRSPAGLLVAIKVIHERYTGDPQFRARFRREVTTARAVSGAFTAPVIDADPEARSPWLVTTFLPGRPLNEVVEEHGPLPPQAVRSLGAGLAEALISIHRAGIVHRDLKPHNVMLTPDGPKVIDFGIAHAADISAITRAGAVVGSPGYMSPEQATGRETGPAGDVFSLGAVLAFAATGSGPFGRARMEVMIYRVVHERPRLDGIGDPGFRSLIEACLAKDPAGRPTPQQLLEWFGTAPQGVSWLPDAMARDIAEHAARKHGKGRRIGRRAFLAAAATTAGVPLGIAAATGGAIWIRKRFDTVPDGKLIARFPAGGTVTAAPAVAAGRLLVATGQGVLVAHDLQRKRELWRYAAGAPLSTSPVIADDTAYIVGDNGVLHAVGMDGQARWKRDLGRKAVPVAAAGQVYVVANGRLLALAGGEVRWSAALPSPGDPVLAGGRVCVPAGGAIRLLHSGTGRAIGEIAQPYADGLTGYGDLLYGGRFAQGELWSYDLAQRKPRWSYRTSPDEKEQHFQGRPAIAAPDRLYLGDEKGSLTALDGAGSPRWRFWTGGAIASAPAAAAKLAYAASADGHLYAIDDASGEARWRYPASPVAPVASGGVVYAVRGSSVHVLKGAL